MSLNIIKPGPLTLIQDFGRYGLQQYGITHGGPLDEHAYLWANHLLNNHYNDAQLEITMGGFSACFTKSTTIAISGADLSATLNGQALERWQSHNVLAGDEIKFASPVSGLRSYLAVKGGFLISPQLGSCATVVRENLGGPNHNGAKISAGDCLNFAETKHTTNRHRQVPERFIPSYQKEISLRFIPNHSATACNKEALQTFTQQSYKVTPQMDRMGYRLESKPIKYSAPSIISQGIAVGTIQLPKDGQPIVLMKDKQTMGGYPQLGCVAYTDLSLLAQCIPGNLIEFISTSIGQCEKELLNYKKFFKLDL